MFQSESSHFSFRGKLLAPTFKFKHKMIHKHKLEEKMEEALEIAWNSESETERNQAYQLTEFWALQYKQLTGHYYVRGCKK